MHAHGSPSPLANGEQFADLARECGAHPQVVAVGINCTPPQHVASLIREARAATDAGIVVYPNSGETYDAVSHGWLPGDACAPFAHEVARWLDAGATIVGGCCRTTPADIAAIRELVDRRPR
jgi:homocysteine S-methyltransferase